MVISERAATAVHRVGPDDPHHPRLHLLLVEDDDADALLVEELLADTGEPFAIIRVRSIAEAARTITATPHIACALVDLGLPDATGLDAVTVLQAADAHPAVVVLTGLNDRARGSAAVAAGAQDYLVKGEVDGPTLAKAVAYAVERRRAQLVAEELLQARNREAANTRLSRGLLPQLQVDPTLATIATAYQPGASRLLGGDFLDAVTRPDGSVRIVIGDVCGHGPLEAALGVALRIAWRTLTSAGASAADTLAGVETMLRLERDVDGTFATLCDLTLEPAAGRVTVRTYGHPPPLLIGPHGVSWLTVDPSPPLGCFRHEQAAAEVIEIPVGAALLLVTDGIYEGRCGDRRVGIDRFADLVAASAAAGLDGAALLDRLVTQAVSWNDGPLDDDVALLWLRPGPR